MLEKTLYEHSRPLAAALLPPFSDLETGKQMW